MVPPNGASASQPKIPRLLAVGIYKEAGLKVSPLFDEINQGYFTICQYPGFVNPKLPGPVARPPSEVKKTCPFQFLIVDSVLRTLGAGGKG